MCLAQRTTAYGREAFKLDTFSGLPLLSPSPSVREKNFTSPLRPIDRKEVANAHVDSAGGSMVVQIMLKRDDIEGTRKEWDVVGEERLFGQHPDQPFVALRERHSNPK